MGGSLGLNADFTYLIITIINIIDIITIIVIIIIIIIIIIIKQQLWNSIPENIKSASSLSTFNTALKDVRANCFCASYCARKFTRHVMH